MTQLSTMAIFTILITTLITPTICTFSCLIDSYGFGDAQCVDNFPDGEEYSCIILTGVPIPNGTNCTEDGHGPMGSCCNKDYQTCDSSTELVCSLLINGEWTEGATCDTCVYNEYHSCCLDDECISVESQQECEDSHDGVYINKACGTEYCKIHNMPYGSCCITEDNSQNQNEFDNCFFTPKAYCNGTWTEGQTCEDAGCATIESYEYTPNTTFPGRCCSYKCDDGYPEDCDSHNKVFQYGQECSPYGCFEQGICHSRGICAEKITEYLCDHHLGGSYVSGGDCSLINNFAGACYKNDDHCSFLTEDACNFLGYEFKLDQSCGYTEGACCTYDSCKEVISSRCSLTSGFLPNEKCDSEEESSEMCRALTYNVTCCHYDFCIGVFHNTQCENNQHFKQIKDTQCPASGICSGNVIEFKDEFVDLVHPIDVNNVSISSEDTTFTTSSILMTSTTFSLISSNLTANELNLVSSTMYISPLQPGSVVISGCVETDSTSVIVVDLNEANLEEFEDGDPIILYDCSKGDINVQFLVNGKEPDCYKLNPNINGLVFQKTCDSNKNTDVVSSNEEADADEVYENGVGHLVHSSLLGFICFLVL
eukprot:TRINITY_DN3141_c0_g1_i1.p1 TRINITY_DN3141_c0_g1~~TRINITY_DN3141_c0_g1_i1.p1  ORF type:complete len:595 (+),score=94.99 TRINITY_DN3141_c0_g1_i1:35-1819(+)